VTVNPIVLSGESFGCWVESCC